MIRLKYSTIVAMMDLETLMHEHQDIEDFKKNKNFRSLRKFSFLPFGDRACGAPHCS